jgi:protein-histidine N-methyltransferase
MSFSFGFSGDDIEHDPTEVFNHAENVADAGQDVPPPIPAQSHDLDELVRRLHHGHDRYMAINI